MLLLARVALAEDDRFHPGPGPETLSMAELLREGVVRGRTGRVLARADDPDAIAALPGVAGVRVLRDGVLVVTPAGDDLALARALHARPDVRWAHPDLLVELHAAEPPDDPFLGDQWHLENTGQGGRDLDVDVDAPDAWTRASGAGVTVAIIDSGVVTDHPDLSVIPGYDYIDRDGDPNPSDGNAHGTCAAGVAAATGGNGYGVTGVAWAADVYAVRLIGGATSLQDVHDAFVESVDAGAAVISNSWGYGDDCPRVPSYELFEEMFDYAETRGRGGLGAVVVFAAGNGNCDIRRDNMLGYPTVVAVAALEGNDVRASYSSYGEHLDVSAPTGLLTTDIPDGGYGAYADDPAFVDGFSGTSAATPVVAGVVALMVEANPRMTAADVREALCATAVRNDLDAGEYDEHGWSPWYGCGRVDAGAAVAAVANGAPSAPVPRLVAPTAWEGRVKLSWEPAADPDGDVLAYELEWAVGADEEGLVETGGTRVDVGRHVDVGDVVTWRVRAADAWGEGPWSEPVSVTVVAEELPPPQVQAPEEPEGCGNGGSALVLLGVSASRWRRRRPAPRG